MEQIDVRILDREFRLAVAPAEKAALLATVRQVDDRMRALRDANRAMSVDRIATMAALQFAAEMRGRDAKRGEEDAVRATARALNAEIEAELARLSRPAPEAAEPGT